MASSVPGPRMIPPLGVLAWVALPALVHLAVLTRFWFDAPLLDDYDCVFDSLRAMKQAVGVREWLEHVFALQNEHRLAGTRLIPQALVWTMGGIDFRLLMLAGTLFVAGAFAFIWSEFRGETTGPIAAAAAFLLLQWSYWEAFLMASASTAHLGVVFFSIGALYYALRPGRLSIAACAAGGILAAFSQANGLFVLPLAGIACLLLGFRRRAILFLLLAAVIWALYFTGYARPPNHPSILRALDDPVKTFQLFLIVIGGVVPSLAISQFVGAIILAGLGWVAWQGAWRRHPTMFLWVAFVLISAATVAAARVGFGLFWGSRYAVNAGLLLAILVFAAYSHTRPWRPRADVAALAAAAVLWAAITIEALPHISERSLRGHLLVEVDPAGRALGLGEFAGMQHPNQEHAARLLGMARSYGWYSPRQSPIPGPTVELAGRRPEAGPPVGVMDEVTPAGSTLVIRGWTDIPAHVTGRKFILHPRDGVRAATLEALQVREDVALALRKPDLVLSGFRIIARFDSDEEARKAAAFLCVYAEAPGRALTEIVRAGVPCR